MGSSSKSVWPCALSRQVLHEASHQSAREHTKMAHQHHLGLAYADYFAAGCSDDGATVVVPDVGADHHHIYGVHQPGAEAFVPAEMVAAKSELGGHHHQFLDFGGHRHQLGHQATTTLTSLSLHGEAAEAASLVRHQLGGLEFRQLQGSAWPQQQGGAWHLVRGSRFLLPTQQLLLEFCSLPVEVTTAATKKPPANDPVNDDGNGGSSSSIALLSARIQAMDAAELQRLKTRLYTMLDGVDRRYRRYREQMKAVAGSFEAVAGARAAAAYTRLASRTISRHFRTLRDGVAAQVEAVRRALGEKDAARAPRAAGVAIKGETTPRLRMLDQCLRQNRAHQAGMLESQPWRPQRGLPERAVSILRAWLFEHFLHPYPSDVDKHILARQTGLSRSQVSNWFINARVRLWKPMVEKMYSEEMKDDDREGECSNANFGKDPNPSSYTSEVQGRGGRAKQGNENDGGNKRKPTRAQLVVHDAGSLASVVSIGSSSSRDQQQNLNFGVMDHLGFGAYDGHHAAADGQQGFGGGGGVSLTLGLHQQHADPHGGVNVAFAGAPSAAHEFLFMAGGGEQQMDVAGGGVYSGGHHFGAGVEGDTGVATLKTNYHLLHDLAS